MAPIRTVLLVACSTLVLVPGSARGQTTYSLGFDGPDRALGLSGAAVTADYFCTLSQAADTGNGAL